MSLLAKYTEQAKGMSDQELRYALADIVETRKYHVYGTPYSDKLYAEYDAYMVELSKREKS